jgi:two-component system response regulator FixJ
MTTPWMTHVIDDDEAVRTAVHFALETAGFRVRSYSGARDFLTHADEERGVIICDIGMPAMTGIELTRWLQLRGPDVRVILITGAPNGMWNAEGISAGAGAVLEKPLALATLLTEIRRATADWV